MIVQVVTDDFHTKYEDVTRYKIVTDNKGNPSYVLILSDSQTVIVKWSNINYIYVDR